MYTKNIIVIIELIWAIWNNTSLELFIPFDINNKMIDTKHNTENETISFR